MLRILLIMVVVIGNSSGADETDMPANVPEKAHRLYDTAVTEVIKKYDAQIARLVGDLEREKADAMKSGRLEAALAIVDLIKQIKNDKILTDIEEHRALVRDPELPIKRMCGHWTWHNDTGASGSFELLADRTYFYSSSEKGRWDLRDGEITIVSPQAKHDIIGHVTGTQAFEAINRTVGKEPLHFTRDP
jgi:hypothetical protein